MRERVGSVPIQSGYTVSYVHNPASANEFYSEYSDHAVPQECSDVSDVAKYKLLCSF